MTTEHGRSDQPQEQRTQGDLENQAKFQFLDHSYKLSLFGEMSEKIKVWSQEKAYLILPSDPQTICLTSGESMKVMRRKIAFWFQEHVSGFPGWRWNKDCPDHLQRNTGTRLSESHKLGLIRSRDAAGFWSLLAQMMLTAFILIPVMFGGAFILCLIEVMSRDLNWTIKHNKTTESHMPLADYFLFIKMFCKIKEESQFKLLIPGEMVVFSKSRRHDNDKYQTLLLLMSVKVIQFIKWVMENVVGAGAVYRYWSGNYCKKIILIISCLRSK